MFNLGKSIKRGISKLLGRNKKQFSKQNIARYVPEPIRKKLEPAKPKSRIKRGLLSIITAGIGLAGVIAGIGISKVVKERLTKKAVLLVGGGEKPSLGVTGFNGYLLKYTDADGLEEMLDTLAANEFTEVVVVPMAVINGYMVENIKAVIAGKRELFEKLSCADALLTSSDDYEKLASTLIASVGGTDEDTAVVYVGKGSTHYANSSYIALSERLKQLGGDNIFIGTLSSYPDFDKVKNDIEAARYQNVILCPLEMTVDEELNDAVAGEENSWYSTLTEEGYNCGCYMKGLCAYRGVRKMVVEHTKSAM